MQTETKEVDSYIAFFPEEVQVILRRFRAIAHEVEPSATEAISYGIPTMRLSGKNVLHFGAYPHHVSIYPIPKDLALRPKLEQFVQGKGTLQFPLTKAPPYELVREIMQAHFAEAKARNL